MLMRSCKMLTGPFMHWMVWNGMMLLSVVSLRASVSSEGAMSRTISPEVVWFDPVIYVDGAEVKEGMQGLNPDSVLSVHISSAGNSDEKYNAARTQEKKQ